MTLYQQQTLPQATYRLINSVDANGDIGGTRIMGSVVRYYFTNPPDATIPDIFTYYKKMLQGAGMKPIFQCIARQCGSAEMAGKWRRVAGFEIKKSDRCSFMSSRRNMGEKTRFAALMVCDDASQLDIIDTAR